MNPRHFTVSHSKEMHQIFIGAWTKEKNHFFGVFDQKSEMRFECVSDSLPAYRTSLVITRLKIFLSRDKSQRVTSRV